MPRLNRIRLRVRCGYCQQEAEVVLDLCGCGVSRPMIGDIQVMWLDRHGSKRDRLIYGREKWKEK